MTNNKILYIVIAILVLAVIGGGLFLFLGNKGGQKEIGTGEQTTASPSTATQTPATGVQTSTADQTMVDCSGKDPGCFFNRMNGCLPVTAKMTGSDGKTAIEVTILGVENEKCHFQRKINNVLDLDCHFPKGTLNENTLDQTFGNDHGLQKVVDDACSRPGW
jgi:hypothetical protein